METPIIMPETKESRSAAKELAKINVPTVSGDLPPGFPPVDEMACIQADLGAQEQISPGYTAFFDDFFYSAGESVLRGHFIVTSDTDPEDTAKDCGERSITVTHTLPVTEQQGFPKLTGHP
ncbi:MAG: hypothetical protein LBV08_09505 [Clostridiales bacterium]|jgi:hypothetical protein|nr:hypothetical protein [Clostridiales bacterium]